MQTGPGAFNAVVPYISLKGSIQVALEPPGQLPLHLFIKFLLENSIQNGSGASWAASFTFPC